VFSVTGSVHFRDLPATGAFVSLHPKAETSAAVPNPRASVGTDGSFVVTTYESQDGAPQGEYVMTIQWYRPVRQQGELVSGPNVLPRKYSTPQTSDLTIQVAAGENRLPPIRLR
jgi:hypothetical protein